jgi:hypothetical protein
LVGCQPTAGSIARSDLPGQDVPLQDPVHIPYLGAEHTAYTSMPPTSGPHVPQTVAPGVYHREIPEELQVHALEHGHVLVQYALNTDADQIRVLEGVARRYSREVVLAPYGQLPAGIALTAWGRIQLLERADPQQVIHFVIAFAGRYDHGWQR